MDCLKKHSACLSGVIKIFLELECDDGTKFCEFAKKKKITEFYLWFFCLFVCFVLFCFVFFLLFRAAPVAYGRSQARGRIRSTAAGLHHNHSNTGPKPPL